MMNFSSLLALLLAGHPKHQASTTCTRAVAHESPSLSSLPSSFGTSIRLTASSSPARPSGIIASSNTLLRPSGSSPASSTLLPPNTSLTCPSYTDLPTITYTTATSYVLTYPFATTTTTLSLVTTEVITVQTDTTVTTVYGPNIVTVTRAPDTRTTLTIAPAATTVTVPGSNPVACQSDYFRTTVTSSVIGTQTVAGDGLEIVWTSTTSGFYYEYTSTVTTGTYATTTFTSVVAPLAVTVATTRQQATSTVYEACASNNVVANFPGGGYIGFILSLPNTLAADAVDCCQLCQATNCTGSVWTPFPSDERTVEPYSLNNCALLTATGTAYFPQATPRYYISNGIGNWAFSRENPLNSLF